MAFKESEDLNIRRSTGFFNDHVMFSEAFMASVPKMKVNLPEDGNWDEATTAYFLYKVMPSYSGFVIPWILRFYQKFHPNFNIAEEKIPCIVNASCSCGDLTSALANHAKSVIAFNTSSYQLEIAKKFNKKANIEYVYGSPRTLTSYCIDHTVDLLVIENTAHLYDIDVLSGQIAKCLKANGIIAIIGLWTPGFQHNKASLSTYFNDSIRKKYPDNDSPYEELMKHYKNLKLPFHDPQRKSDRSFAPMRRSEVEAFLMLNKGMFKDKLPDDIDKTMVQLGREMSYALITEIFAIFAHT